MLSFSYLIAVRSYFIVGAGKLGESVAGISISALLFMVGIVNRGVASGSGDGARYGANVLSLFQRYAGLLISKYTLRPFRFRPLEAASIAILAWSMLRGAKAVFCEDPDD